MMQMFYSYNHIINTVYQLYELSLLLIILLKCPPVQDLLSYTSIWPCVGSQLVMIIYYTKSIYELLVVL